MKGGHMAFQKEEKVHYVEITCADGEFSYSNDGFEVARGEFIEWSCDESNGDYYTVIIGERTPFEWKEKRKKCGKKIKDKIKDEAESGEYKYNLSVEDGGNTWTDDPVFIVKRP